MLRLSAPRVGLSALIVSTLLVGAGAADAWPLGGPLYSHGFANDPPPSLSGYNLDDPHPGYYGGGHYREYYSYGRGYGLANFPGPLPSIPYARPLLAFPRPPSAPAGPIELPPLPLDGVAHLELEVPEGAQVQLEGATTEQSGTRRIFVSPPLLPGWKYAYEIRARWTEKGRPVEQTQTVIVHAGDRLHVTFPVPLRRDDLPAAPDGADLPQPKVYSPEPERWPDEK